MVARFAYGAADERAQAPNPSLLDIEPDRLLAHLRWYRSHLIDYVRYKGGEAGPVIESGDGGVAPSIADELIEEAVGKTFALEKDLQAALRANLAQLEDGLTVEDGGYERKVDAGFIDILARDAAGVLTVIELKAEVSKPEAVAQILAYMGCVAEETGELVRGILVAGEHHSRVVYASKAIPNLGLKKYRFRFEFD